MIQAGGWSTDVKGDKLAIADDQALQVWDISNWQPTKLAEHEGRYIAVAISPDQSKLVTGGFDNESALTLWGLTEDTLHKEISWNGRNQGPIRSGPLFSRRSASGQRDELCE